MLKNIALSIALLIAFCANLVLAQKPYTPAFPDWMDKVDFNKQNKNEIMPIQQPVDPTTGKPANDTCNSGKYKPKLPDFSKMREKAIKAETERRVNESNCLEESYSASLTNIEQFKTQKQQLETLLATDSKNINKPQVLKEIEILDEKIKLSEELVTLVGTNESKKAIASMTSDCYRRVLDIQKLLFADKTKPKTKQEPTKTQNKIGTKNMIPSAKKQTLELTEDSTEEEIEAARMRRKHYRPGQTSSFYLESKKNKITPQETENE